MASLAVLVLNPLLRAGLAALLRTMGFEPVQEAADLKELMRRENNDWRPQLLLVSLRQDDKRHAALMIEVRAWAPDAKVAFIAPVLDIPSLSACFAAGAAGYLLENISRDGLQHSLQLMSAGENVFPSELATMLHPSALHFRGITSPRGPIQTVNELRNLHATNMEINILRCVATGESNSSIARQFGISDAEVSSHMKQILRKLRVSNRTQAALWGVARGLAAPFAALTQLAENTEGEETNGDIDENAQIKKKSTGPH
jgi:two-component system nitrate/nitrite response regulator NarL